MLVQPRLSRIIAIVAGAFLFTAFVSVLFQCISVCDAAVFGPFGPCGSARLFLLLIHEVELPVRAVLDAILLLLLWLLDNTNSTKSYY